MRFKKIIPYILTMSAFLLTNAPTSPYTQKAKANNSTDYKNFNTLYSLSAHMETDYDTTPQITPKEKSTLLINTYIDNAISGIQRIQDAKKTQPYVRAVRSELPGAPCNSEKHGGTLHCLYGQYTQLQRTLKELGDTIQIIPKTEDNAHMSSLSFKRHMAKLYNKPEYPNAIYSGHLYPTKSEYTRALNKYVKQKCIHVRTNNIDSLHLHYADEFTKDNYCADMLNPGSIIIVNIGHAIMYLGQGHIKNKQFVPDSINGTAICCSYNIEHTAVKLTKWGTTKSFAADIKNIATVKYEQEYKRADSLARAELAKTYEQQQKSNTVTKFITKSFVHQYVPADSLEKDMNIRAKANNKTPAKLVQKTTYTKPPTLPLLPSTPISNQPGIISSDYYALLARLSKQR